MRAALCVLVLVGGFGLACSGVDASPVEREPTPAPEPEPERRGKARRRAPAPVENDGPWVPPADPCAARSSDGTYKVDFTWNGERTRALLYVPEGGGSRPLVVLLHGGGADAATILRQTRFDDEARDEGFALLVPGAAPLLDRGPRWNTGKFSSRVPESEQRDDVAYLDALVAKIGPQVCADRVLAAGFSNGGQMVHRWACQGSRADAVLSAAGTLLVDPDTCRGPRAIQAWVGDRDDLFDKPPLEGSDMPSAVKSVELWSRINRCSSQEPSVTRNGDSRCQTWKGCEAPTELCVVEGFPHGWPSPWHARGSTRTNATEAGWAWFERLPR